MPASPLSDGYRPPLRALLSLPLVPARDRRIVRVECDDRGGPPSASGSGQKIARCPKCRIALWSNYAGAGPLLKFVRVGTLDLPDHLPPDIHIFTASKQPWVTLSPGIPAVPEYYDREKYWPAESLERRKALLPQIEAYQASRRQTGR